MRGSIPASDTAELPPVRLPSVGGAPWGPTVGRILRTPAGAVGATLTLLVAILGFAGPWLAPWDPFAVVGPGLAPPSAPHPLGTDVLGRDLLSGVLHGARTSVIVALGAGTLVLTLGLAVGLVSGYRGGRTDDVAMRAVEFFQVLPRFFLAIVAVALFGPGIDRVVLVLGLTSWAILARVVRSETLSIREREFVLAARTMGASDISILLRDVLPAVLPAALVMLGLIAGQVILLEASLGFLGLGDPNAMSWGYLVGQAQPFLRTAWWLSVFPGLAILGTVLGLNLLADAVTRAVGPS